MSYLPPLTIRRIFGAATGPKFGGAGQSASIGAGGSMLAKALVHIGIGAVEMEGMLELPHFDIDLLTRRLCRAARWLGEQDATLPCMRSTRRPS
jgi:hypothetical protein